MHIGQALKLNACVIREEGIRGHGGVVHLGNIEEVKDYGRCLESICPGLYSDRLTGVCIFEGTRGGVESAIDDRQKALVEILCAS